MSIRGYAGKVLGLTVKKTMEGHMAKVFASLLIFIPFIVIAVAIGGLLAYPVMLLWNGCLVSAITGVCVITWKQAWGLMILCSILFKSSSTSSSSDNK